MELTAIKIDEVLISISYIRYDYIRLINILNKLKLTDDNYYVESIKETNVESEISNIIGRKYGNAKVVIYNSIELHYNMNILDKIVLIENDKKLGEHINLIDDKSDSINIHDKINIVKLLYSDEVIRKRNTTKSNNVIIQMDEYRNLTSYYLSKRNDNSIKLIYKFYDTDDRRMQDFYRQLYGFELYIDTYEDIEDTDNLEDSNEAESN